MSGNRTIMCVGDDAFGLEVRRLVLESFGYNAIVKPDCEAALVVLGLRRVDLVIFDFSDLNEAHSDCIRALKRRNPEQRLMLLAPVPYVEQATAELVDCVLTKGILPSEFKEAIEKCVNPKHGRGKLKVALSVAGAWMGVAAELIRTRKTRVSTTIHAAARRKGDSTNSSRAHA